MKGNIYARTLEKWSSDIDAWVILIGSKIIINSSQSSLHVLGVDDNQEFN